MIKILLMRHGQAQFGHADYDHLSPNGFLQARRVADAMYESGEIPDIIASGSLKRQRQTAEQLLDRLGDDLTYQCMPWLNELDSAQLIRHYGASVFRTETRQSIELSEVTRESFPYVLKQLITRWHADEQCPFESFKQFKARIIQGLELLTSSCHQGSSQANTTILLVTSGGVIASVIQHLQQLNLEQLLDSALKLRNASITEILIDQKEWTLGRVNWLPERIEGNNELVTVL
ncbi:histidine phosphatase family protein [Pleionea litopenaei]|uniref:Histidine phosphatase family protein n=1 Tax=Pleionea litopenaei TaxID=3070815 RepID=A0AA51X7K2_9GAMM|nr:histidine phosphatase family protein [Pleionea sp. HL-JVS1]WMS88298.1 histidine phosphatase family protein [Pleionea sp. HL-JVS1]